MITMAVNVVFGGEKGLYVQMDKLRIVQLNVRLGGLVWQ